MLPFPSPPNYLFDSSFSALLEVSQPPQRPTPPSPLFAFSPPPFDGFHDLLFSSQFQPMPDVGAVVPPPPVYPSPDHQKEIAAAPPTDEMRVTGGAAATTGRKRAMRKDRHSKIFTAQGPRDRRMRLSVDVARKFFDLQDELGFDKPSKTLQWLLTKSKSAIMDVTSGASRKLEARAFSVSSNNSSRSESSTSECEDVSTVSDSKGKSLSSTTAASRAKTMKAKRGSDRLSSNAAYHLSIAKELRAKARARARERTREKKRMQCVLLESNGRPNQLISSSIPFDPIKEESISEYPKPSLELAAIVESPFTLERVLGGVPVAVGSGTAPIFDYNQLSTVGANRNIVQEQREMMHYPGNEATWLMYTST